MEPTTIVKCATKTLKVKNIFKCMYKCDITFCCSHNIHFSFINNLSLLLKAEVCI